MSLWLIQKKPLSPDGVNLHAFYFDGSPGSCEEAMRFSKGFKPILNSAGNFSGRMDFLGKVIFPCEWIVIDGEVEKFGDEDFRRTFDFIGRYDFGVKETATSPLIPVSEKMGAA